MGACEVWHGGFAALDALRRPGWGTLAVLCPVLRRHLLRPPGPLLREPEVPAAFPALKQAALAESCDRPTDVPRSFSVGRQANFDGVKPLAPEGRGHRPALELFEDVALQKHATAALGAVVGHEQNLPLPPS